MEKLSKDPSTDVHCVLMLDIHSYHKQYNVTVRQCQAAPMACEQTMWTKPESQCFLYTNSCCNSKAGTRKTHGQGHYSYPEVEQAQK